MTTMTQMRDRIRREIDREDLDDAIVTEIRSAIDAYRARRFYFNERRGGVTFPTVSAQSDYDGTSVATLANIVEIDDVSLVADGAVRRLRPSDPARLNAWLGSNSNPTGAPTTYSFYGGEMRFYPRPNDAYPVTVSGLMRVPPPATDDEDGNPWLGEADELIRSRTKKSLYASWMGDGQTAQVMDSLESAALDNLLAETGRRSSFRFFTPDTL